MGCAPSIPKGADKAVSQGADQGAESVKKQSKGLQQSKKSMAPCECLVNEFLI